MTGLEFFKNLCDRKSAVVSLIIIKSPCQFFKPEIPPLVSTRSRVKHSTFDKSKERADWRRCRTFYNFFSSLIFVNLYQEDIFSVSISLYHLLHVWLYEDFPWQYFLHKSNHLRIANCRRWLLCCYFRKFNKYLIQLLSSKRLLKLTLIFQWIYLYFR